jgi:hypothetical protein
MKRSRLIALLLMLSLLCACFVSAPVLAEHPWDADAGGGSSSGIGQTMVDSSQPPANGGPGNTNQSTSGEADPQVSLLGWLWELMMEFGRGLICGGASTGSSTVATDAPAGSGK